MEMTGPWKAWKSKSGFPPLSTAPWESRKRREIPTFPQPLQPAAQGRKAFGEEGDIQEEKSGHRDPTTHVTVQVPCRGRRNGWTTATTVDILNVLR